MTRPSLSSQEFLYTPYKRPFLDRSARIVTNRMAVQYRTYLKSGSSYWNDFPTSTTLIDWGETVDGTQSFTANTDGVTGSVYGVFSMLSTPSGATYIVSFTASNISGTIAEASAVLGVTTSGTASVAVAANGRYAHKFTTTSAGTMSIRLGIGCWGDAQLNASIKISNVMIERIYDSRTYPYEYVNAGDARAFDYTYSCTLSGAGLITGETVGTSVVTPSCCSVLVVGDSMTDDVYVNGAGQGDFPEQMRVYVGKRMAVSTYGVSGQRIDETEAQLVYAMKNRVDSRALPWKVVILQGATNDVAQGASATTIQARQLSRIALARSYGLIPVCINCPPRDVNSGAQNTELLAYNAWANTYHPANNIPYYDIYTHADDGTGKYKTNWGTPDGTHPGQGENQGSMRWTRKMISLVSNIP